MEGEHRRAYELLKQLYEAQFVVKPHWRKEAEELMTPQWLKDAREHEISEADRNE